jgi:methyltransferase (TIGR00027 family)
MFQGLRGIVYKVSDIEKARDWYSKVFDTKPVFDMPFAVVFAIGDSIFALSTSTNTAIKSDDSVIAYWEVSDIDAEYKRLLQLGATVHTEISIAFNRKRGAVIDPFGNILGIRSTTEDVNKGTIEQQPSQTAMGAAIARALSAVDEREEIRGHDYLAEIFLPENIKASLRDPAAMKEMMTNRMPGMYEYIVARTAYFDRIVEGALRENFSQIVFLGAGYDTRPYRFKDLIEDTRIFELDIHTTQQQKIKLLRQHNVSIPGQLTFVSINFNKETLEDVLFKAGYIKDQKNLFIWEGVTYYLSPKAVDDTLYFIKSSSLIGSTVCFDYGARWPEMLEAYGVKKLAETMKTDYSGEATGFGIERGKIESFLSDRGYKIIEHLTAVDMERKFLTLRDGSLAGNVVGHFCFVHALVFDTGQSTHC